MTSTKREPGARPDDLDSASPPPSQCDAPPEEPGRVTIVDPPTMSLLGLLLGSLVERRAADPTMARKIARLRGDVVVEAGKMVITLSFRQGQVSVSRGACQTPRARVSGSMEALLRIALGGGMVAPWLQGRIRTQGNLLLLLRMMPLLRA